MPSKIQIAAILGAVAASVNAHGHIEHLKIDGTDFTSYDPSFQYQNPTPEVVEWSCPNCLDNGFVPPNMYTDVNKIACHKDATSGAKVAKIAAGASMDIQWNTWPESHVGPIMDYMAKVDDATSAKAADLKFFKIAEEGYVNGVWAGTKIIKNNLTWTVTIPSSIAPGQYVLRHEILALHSAGQEDGAQNYPKCFNLEVTGSGTENPTGVTADKFYTPTDPGILYNVYSGDHTSYKIPGPALFSGASSSSSSSSSKASEDSPAKVSPVAKNVAVASATPTASASPVASAAPTSSPSSDSSLPETFTLNTFISWLEKTAGSSSSKARRHSRAFRG